MFLLTITLQPEPRRAIPGLFCFAPPQLAASSISRPPLRHSLRDFRDQLFDDDVPE